VIIRERKKEQSEWGAAWQTLLLILEEMSLTITKKKESSLLEGLEKLKKEKE